MGCDGQLAAPEFDRLVSPSLWMRCRRRVPQCCASNQHRICTRP